MIYSFSRLSLYEGCPFRFLLKYVEGYEEPISKPLALGKAVHTAIEALIKGENLFEATLKGWAETDFFDEISVEEISFLVQKAPVYQGMGETEVHFCLPLSSDCSAPKIQGYVDLVQDNKVVDWKTNWRPYNILDNHQVGLYTWAVSKLRKKEVIEGELFFLRWNKRVQHIFTKEGMEKARKWALRLVKEIEKKLFLLDTGMGTKENLFPSTPSTKCRQCPFAIKCLQVRGVVNGD